MAPEEARALPGRAPLRFSGGVVWFFGETLIGEHQGAGARRKACDDAGQCFSSAAQTLRGDVHAHALHEGDGAGLEIGRGDGAYLLRGLRHAQSIADR